jgi:hypothetical protein
MSQRIVERIIGRLITDEEFRVQFADLPEPTLVGLIEQGWELTAIQSEDRQGDREVAKLMTFMDSIPRSPVVA